VTKFVVIILIWQANLPYVAKFFASILI